MNSRVFTERKTHAKAPENPTHQNNNAHARMARKPLAGKIR